MSRTQAEALLAAVDTDTLSVVLNRALRFALEAQDEEFVRWIRLELHGYFHTNPALGDDIQVPSYRTVAGQHLDEYGRTLRVENPRLAFIYETRLRWGVPDLEALLKKGGMATIHDPVAAQILREHLHVEVSRYSFDTCQIPGILAAIRSHLAEFILKSAPNTAVLAAASAPNTSDEIVELRPNFMGFGVNLRALGRWIVRRWRRTEA